MIFLSIITLSVMCKSRNLSIYQILSEKKIIKVTIKSCQFIKDGKVLTEMGSQNDIDYFKSWFKPSIKSSPDPSAIKQFKSDGFIIILTEDGRPLEIYYDLFNCYKMNYKGEDVYEQFSYQFGHTLLELFEEEAKNAGKKFKE